MCHVEGGLPAAMGVRGSPAFALLLGIQLACLLVLPSCLGQLSKPVAHDANMKDTVENNKFMQREATDDLNPLPAL